MDILSQAPEALDAIPFGLQRPDPDLGDFVDPNVFCVPSAEDTRHVDHTAAADYYDGAVQKLRVMRGTLERQLGRRLARLRQVAGFIKLGFSRASDYHIERLETSTRSAQEMMRVAEALDDLPALRQALDEAVITPSHARAVARVATAETDAAWAELAAKLTVRALRAEVKRHEQEGTAPVVRNGVDEDEQDGVRVSFRCPPRLKGKWLFALEVFRKLEGHDGVPEGAAAEAFAAEWQSGADLAVLAASPTPDPKPSPEPEPAEETSGLEQRLEELSECWRFLTQDVPEVLKPEWLEALDGELSDDPAELDAELVKLARALRQLDGMTGRLLVTISRVGLIRAMCFASLGHYARERAGVKPSKARELNFIERRLFYFPRLRDAWLRGELGTSKLRQLLKVSDQRTEEPWLERAQRVTVRRLEDEVRLVQLRAAAEWNGVTYGLDDLGPSRPPDPGADLRKLTGELEERLGCHTSAPSVIVDEVERNRNLGERISFWLEQDAYEVWRAAVAAVRRAEGWHLEEWECVERFLDAFLETWALEDPRNDLLRRVLERDGYRCTVPGCRNRNELHGHHLTPRSAGGPDTEENLTVTCGAHHIDGVHQGHIRVVGHAPHGLVWELGYRNGLPLLIVGPGERVLRRPRNSP